MQKDLKQLAKAAESHYLAYFMNNLSLEVTTFYELIGEERQQRLLSDNEDLQKIVDYIMASLKSPESWLKTDQGTIDEKIEALFSHRSSLSDQVAVLAGYDDRLKMYRYILERRKEAGAKLHTNDEDLAGELVNFIFEYEDSMSINDRVKAVYGELPVRMSRMKFHEWVETALAAMKGVSVRDLVNYSTYLKETYYPEGIEGYGTISKGLFKEINSFEALLTDIVAGETIEEMEAKMAGLQLILEDAVGLFTFTASVVNNMIGILSTLNAHSLEVNKEEEALFIRLMHKLYERREEAIIIDEELVAIFDGISLKFNDMMMENGRHDSVIEEAKESRLEEIVAAGLEDRFDRLASLYILQSSSYFAPVRFAVEDLEMVDQHKLIEVKKDLLSYLDKASEGEDRMAKRARIANLFGVLNVIQSSAQEIHAYMLTSLNGCKDEREKNGTIRVLRDLMTV